ncbi:TPA: hypothetical protein JAZ38_01680 [Legionella pneumophila]|nr:hypothetical protein [Legionella pneumophila]HAT7758342.1 hypothetical protein [Legionella pneumophila]HAU2064303.1 hypothetical protein [Legionella pneumophila]HCX3288497.1 hypothetical protein [Legionella pneumophila]
MPSACVKLFSVCFDKKDGTIYVHFPYQPEKNGILGEVELKPQKKPEYTFSLLESGKVTSHKVKYSHHPDGNAHFSQDKKIFTEIKTKSVELKKYNGHIFTILISKPSSFERLSNKERNYYSEKRITLKFNYESDQESLAFVCYLFNGNYLKSKADNGIPKHKLILNDTYCGFLTENPFIDDGDSHYLYISQRGNKTCKVDHDKSSLLFLGGFDERATSLNLNKPTKFLITRYPISNNEEDIFTDIESIDIPQDFFDI